MSTFKFHANCVVTQDPNCEGHLVGFADQDAAQIYLMLQRAYEYDEQDRELGMDTYYVEWCNQENSGYGGISQFSLHRNLAELIFDPDVSAELDDLHQISISFKLDENQFESLKQALQKIFENSNCLKI
ncbi:Imm10 family immunity protein [Undibacterium macrobrachii]|jgi:hypothetical protein|uniref:Uncharacterized protein n=1 Tax=Undibacterium macrobrachii TaxID=1119058 RepID=A0ABQ2X9R7_9BURK|nr:Imm10 family immunity protein [Undibacterium macrobrachii]GGX06561.1 hypothetical protein GCM10011282_11190 [Undibacterium macrobrachii]